MFSLIFIDPLLFGRSVLMPPAEQKMVDLTLQGFLSPGARHVAVHVGKQFFEVEQSAIGFAVFVQPVLHPEPSDPIMQQSLNLSIGDDC